MKWLMNTVRPILPTAQFEDFRFVSIDKEKADFSIAVTITNPSFLPIPLADASYFFESQNKRPFYGTIAGLKPIKPHKSRVITVPISVVYTNAVDFFGQIEPGSVLRYRARLEVVLKLPVVGRFTVPVEKKGEFLMPFVPRIRLRELAAIGGVSNEEVNVRVGFEVENRNEFGVVINGLELRVCDERGKMVASVKLDGGRLEILKGGGGYVRVSVCLRLEDIVFGLWGRKGFSFDARADVDSPWGQIKYPFNLNLSDV